MNGYAIPASTLARGSREVLPYVSFTPTEHRRRDEQDRGPQGQKEAGAEVGLDGVRLGAAQVIDVFDVQAEGDEEVERHEDESDETCRRGDTESRRDGGHHRRDEQHPVRLVQAVDDDRPALWRRSRPPVTEA